MFWLELAVLVLVTAASASMIWHSFRVGITPMPTMPSVKRTLLAMVDRGTTGEIHELGAGFGTLAFALADACPDARVIAWETSPVPFAVLRLRQRLWPRVNLELRRRDFLEGDLSGASLAVCFLWTGGMKALAPKLEAQLRPGATVLSHTFAVRGWQPTQTLHAPDRYRTPIYRYVMPIRR